FVDADCVFAARTPRRFLGRVMQFDGVAFDDNPQIAAAQINTFAVTGGCQPDRLTVLLGDLDRHDQAALNDALLMAVGTNDKLVANTRDAMTAELAHDPVQVAFSEPAILAQQRTQPLTLGRIDATTGN